MRWLRSSLAWVAMVTVTGTQAQQMPTCFALAVWEPELTRSLTLAQPTLEGGLELMDIDHNDETVTLLDVTTEEYRVFPLDETFELSVTHEPVAMNPAAQSAPWKIEVTEFEAFVLELPLSEIEVAEQRIFVGDSAGCVPRLVDNAQFQADRVWVDDGRLKAQGKMMRYERIIFGGGNSSAVGLTKGG